MPLPGEPVEAVDLEAPPGDAAGEDDRPRLEDVAAVEVDRGASPGRSARSSASRGSRRRAASPAAARGRPARRPRRRTGSRGSSRSATTCPPGRPAPRARSRSCCSPSEAPYTAAASPAGPPPTIDRVVRRRPSASRLELEQLRDPAQLAAGLTVFPLASTRRVGWSSSGGSGPSHFASAHRSSGLDPVDADLVAVEEAAETRAHASFHLSPMTSRPRRRRLDGDVLQPSDPHAARAHRPRR